MTSTRPEWIRRAHWLKPIRVAERFLPVVLFLALWELVADSNIVDQAFLPSVRSILAALGDLLIGGEIEDNLFISLFRSFTGLALAILIGILCGLGMATSKTVDGFLSPLVSATYSLPKSALVPLLFLWFGIGSTTNITVVFLACLLPIVVHTYHGANGVPTVIVWSARAMGTAPRTMLWRIIIPAALPSILTGIRIALAFSFVLTLSAEMIASTAGIGRLIFMYGENGAYNYMFAAIASVVAVAYVADRGLLALMRVRLRWHDLSQHELAP